MLVLNSVGLWQQSAYAAHVQVRNVRHGYWSLLHVLDTCNTVHGSCVARNNMQKRRASDGGRLDGNCNDIANTPRPPALVDTLCSLRARVVSNLHQTRLFKQSKCKVHLLCQVRISA